MTRRAISVYMAATCAMVVVAPGRFVCGIIIAIELCCLMLFGLLFRAFLEKLKLEKMLQGTMLCFIVFLTILLKQLLILFMPETALQLGYVLYLPAISTFTTVFLLEENAVTLKQSLKHDMTAALMFSAYVLLISLMRDVVGYGTISLPSAGKQLEIVIFDPERISAASFLATIPGALVLTAMFLALFLFVENKFNIIKKAGKNQ